MNKIVCISNIVGGNGRNGFAYAVLPITVGRVYDYIIEYSDCYYMIGDTGYKYDLSKELFVKLEDYRNNRLNELGV